MLKSRGVGDLLGEGRLFQTARLYLPEGRAPRGPRRLGARSDGAPRELDRNVPGRRAVCAHHVETVTILGRQVWLAQHPDEWRTTE